MDLLLSVVATKGGEKFGRLEGEYNNIDDATLGATLGMADKIWATASKVANKGGPLLVSLTRTVTGGAGSGSGSFSGVTYNGLCDIQEEMDTQRAKLKKMGRDHAAKKDKGK